MEQGRKLGRGINRMGGVNACSEVSFVSNRSIKHNKMYRRDLSAPFFCGAAGLFCINRLAIAMSLAIKHTCETL